MLRLEPCSHLSTPGERRPENGVNREASGDAIRRGDISDGVSRVPGIRQA